MADLSAAVPSRSPLGGADSPSRDASDGRIVAATVVGAASQGEGSALADTGPKPPTEKKKDGTNDFDAALEDQCEAEREDEEKQERAAAENSKLVEAIVFGKTTVEGPAIDVASKDARKKGRIANVPRDRASDLELASDVAASFKGSRDEIKQEHEVKRGAVFRWKYRKKGTDNHVLYVYLGPNTVGWHPKNRNGAGRGGAKGPRPGGSGF